MHEISALQYFSANHCGKKIYCSVSWISWRPISYNMRVKYDFFFFLSFPLQVLFPKKKEKNLLGKTFVYWIEERTIY